MSAPCIIEVALNGVVKKDVNPMGPRSPAEIVGDALGCSDSGATIVHNHNDEYLWAEGGVHSAAPYIEAWGPILEAHPDALLYATMDSGGAGSAMEVRWVPQIELAPA